MEQPDVLGYRVEKLDGEHVPYLLHGPRGARYALLRNVPNPSMLFAVNDRSFVQSSAAERLGWFTDRNGVLEHVGR
jgi:hypothetical protein